MSSGPVLETRELTKRYRRTVVVRALSISIPAGGITALLGPNGAGKSTLLKLCVGFERPTSGGLTVMGIDPVRRRRDALSVLGYVPQAPSLYRDMRIDAHLRLARALRPTFDLDYARDRLNALDISPSAIAGQLSGGQQAQAALAALDPLARREFVEVASDAANGGDVSIVLSSHVLSEIEFIADRLLVLGEGRVLFEDTITSSVARHRVLDDGANLDGLDVVAPFPGQGRARHILIRSSDPAVGRAGTLEEVVMGYLALGRRAP
jgi:ABC-2 type transport system ATP-binding protein